MCSSILIYDVSLLTVSKQWGRLPFTFKPIPRPVPGFWFRLQTNTKQSHMTSKLLFVHILLILLLNKSFKHEAELSLKRDSFT